MNDCDRVCEMMHDALDSGTAEPGREVRNHMAECADCLRLWERLVSADTALRMAARPVQDAPAGLHAGIMDAVRGGRSDRVRQWRRTGAGWRIALAAAALVIVAGTLALIQTHHDTDVGAAPFIVASGVPTQVPQPALVPSAAEPLLDEAMRAALKDAVLPEVIVATAQDFSLLADAIRSNTASAARAMLP